MKFLNRLSIITVFFVGYSSFAQSKIDVLHYKFEIGLNDKNDTIYGKAEITLVSPKISPVVEFDLSGQNDDGKGMIIDSIRSNKPGHAKILLQSSPVTSADLFSHTNNKLLLNFNYGRIDNVSTNLKDTFSVTIYYHGVPADGLIISKSKYGKRTFFADNWPNRAHHWIPCVDDPADKASVEFIVTAPDHYKVVSNGVLIEEKNISGNKKQSHWKEEVPLPTKIMVIGVADFAVDRAGEVNGIPVYSWVYSTDREKGFYDYAQAVEILSFLIDYIGPYPYKKLANVQSKTIFGGMENANAIFYHENSVTGDRNEEALLAHEIAHQWFGDMVTEKSFAHLWLSEGFATYLTHIYMESGYGTDSLNKRMEEDRKEIIDFTRQNELPVVDSVTPFMALLNANSYQKGSWILHMLRRELGDAVFHKIIRTYYSRCKGANADSKDFQAVAEEISGKKLDIFFQQWLHQPGIPRLDINWKYDDSKKEIIFTIRQTQKTGLYEFPLEIMAQQNPLTDPIIFTCAMKKETESFSFPLNAKPTKVIIDPSISLLFE